MFSLSQLGGKVVGSMNVVKNNRKGPTMPIPFVIDNQQHRMADALNELLAQSVGKPLDIASAYFAISGYRLVKEGLH